jgi:hypothetical protein
MQSYIRIHPYMLEITIPVTIQWQAMAKSLYYVTTHFHDKHEGKRHSNYVRIASASAVDSHHDPMVWFLSSRLRIFPGPTEGSTPLPDLPALSRPNPGKKTPGSQPIPAKRGIEVQ